MDFGRNEKWNLRTSSLPRFLVRVRRERRGPWMKCRVRTINKLFYSRMISLFSDIWLILNNFYMKPALSGIFPFLLFLSKICPFSRIIIIIFSFFFTILGREEKISTGNLISNDARTTNERTYAMRTRDRGLLNSMRDRTVASMARESHTGKYASIIAWRKVRGCFEAYLSESSASTAAACADPLVTIAGNGKGMVDRRCCCTRVEGYFVR